MGKFSYPLQTDFHGSTVYAVFAIPQSCLVAPDSELATSIISLLTVVFFGALPE